MQGNGSVLNASLPVSFLGRAGAFWHLSHLSSSVCRSQGDRQRLQATTDMIQLPQEVSPCASMKPKKLTQKRKCQLKVVGQFLPDKLALKWLLEGQEGLRRPPKCLQGGQISSQRLKVEGNWMQKSAERVSSRFKLASSWPEDGLTQP